MLLSFFMAEIKNKFPENVAGKYYVDRECISCDACYMAAPQNFAMNEDDGHAYVKKQPEGSVEEDQCRDAMEGCPVFAIGNDGATK